MVRLLLALLCLITAPASAGLLDDFTKPDPQAKYGLMDSRPNALVLRGDWILAGAPPATAPVAAGQAKPEMISINFAHKETIRYIPAARPVVPLDEKGAAEVAAKGLTGARLLSFIPVSPNGEVVLMKIERQVGTTTDRGGNMQSLDREFYLVAANTAAGWMVLGMAGADQYNLSPVAFAFDPVNGSVLLTASYMGEGRVADTSSSSQLSMAMLLELIRANPALLAKHDALGVRSLHLESGFRWASTRNGFSTTTSFILCGIAGCKTDVLGKGVFSGELIKVRPGFVAVKVRDISLP